MAINATSFPYELTNITGTGNIFEFVQNINNLTGQWFMLGMLLAGFVILYVSMREGGNEDALVATSFIMAILSITFFALGFISAQYLTVIIIAFAFLFVVKMIKGT